MMKNKIKKINHTKPKNICNSHVFIALLYHSAIFYENTDHPKNRKEKTILFQERKVVLIWKKKKGKIEINKFIIKIKEREWT